MAIINRELAEVIANKLGGERKDKTRHIWVTIRHNGVLIAQFGIRRGSDKELGHDHIPAQIHLHKRQAKLLGQCTMSQQEWIEEMKRQGYIQ
jgi:hypothetical protein